MRKITFDEEELFAIAVFEPAAREKTVEQMEEVLAELSEDPEMKALLVSVKEKLSRISDKDFEQLDLESYRDELEEEDEEEGTPEEAEDEEG